MEGFEPPHGGTKNRCLTAWRRPSKDKFMGTDYLSEQFPRKRYYTILLNIIKIIFYTITKPGIMKEKGKTEASSACGVGNFRSWPEASRACAKHPGVRCSAPPSHQRTASRVMLLRPRVVPSIAGRCRAPHSRVLRTKCSDSARHDQKCEWDLSRR